MGGIMMQNRAARHGHSHDKHDLVLLALMCYPLLMKTLHVMLPAVLIRVGKVIIIDR